MVRRYRPSVDSNEPGWATPFVANVVRAFNRCVDPAHVYGAQDQQSMRYDQFAEDSLDFNVLLEHGEFHKTQMQVELVLGAPTTETGP